MERVDSNSGVETRQGQKKNKKKEVGGETKTAIQPDATVELEPKTLQSDRAAGGEGPKGLWCVG